MKISAILLARTIALLDINDLNPRGRFFFPILVPKLVERFAFQGFPSKAEDYDEAKGVKFSDGFFDGRHINNLTVYNDGIKIETRSGTEDGRRVLIDSLEWLTTLGLDFSEKMITRWGFVSQLSFYSKVDFVAVHPALSVASERVTEAVSARIGTQRTFAPFGFTLNFEKGDATIPMASFNVERREKTPYSEGKYFSMAPLETSSHIKVLEEMEENLRAS